MRLLSIALFFALSTPLAAQGLHDIRKVRDVDGRALMVFHTCTDPSTIPAQYDDRGRYASVMEAAPSRLDQASHNRDAAHALRMLNAVILIGEECLADFLAEFESRGGSEADLVITKLD